MTTSAIYAIFSMIPISFKIDEITLTENILDYLAIITSLIVLFVTYFIISPTYIIPIELFLLILIGGIIPYFVRFLFLIIKNLRAYFP